MNQRLGKEQNRKKRIIQRQLFLYPHLGVSPHPPESLSLAASSFFPSNITFIIPAIWFLKSASSNQ